MKTSNSPSFVSTVFLAGVLSQACSDIPLNPPLPDADTDATFEMTDGGVPAVDNEINYVLSEAHKVLEASRAIDGGITEQNYARTTAENPLINEVFRPRYYEYNSSVEVAGFGEAGEPEARVDVHIYDKASSTLSFAEMYARVNSAAGTSDTELSISIYTDKCTVPAPTDELTLSFDFSRAECGQEYTNTTMTLRVSHVDPDSPDMGDADVGVDSLPGIIDACTYTHNTGRMADMYGNLKNIPAHTTTLAPGDPYCSVAALAVVDALNTELDKRKVCSPILPKNLVIRVVDENTCTY